MTVKIPQKLQLSVYTADEVRQMSVKEIHVPQSHNSVGIPNLDGLHDPYLGPTERSEVCVRCGLSSGQCLGHFGYISLPIPVFTPILFDHLMTILKSICFECCKFSTPKKRVLLAKSMLKCLKHGWIVSYNTLRDFFPDTTDSKVEDDQFNRTIKKIVRTFKSGLDQPGDNSKTLRDAILTFNDEFFRNYIIRKDSCPNCGARMPKPVSEGVGIVNFKSIVNQKLVTRRLYPWEAKDILLKFWREHCDILTKLFTYLTVDKTPIDVFLSFDILVTPSRFRPTVPVKGHVVEHIKTQQYSAIILSCITIREMAGKFREDDEVTPDVVKQWETLQRRVSALYVGERRGTTFNVDFKKFLEKKAGIIRQNLMGKRVNFAARSVISPDPLLSAEEVGIPLNVATQLTFPERITSYNFRDLRAAVINGPSVHPGASFLVDGGKTVYLNPANDRQRLSIAERLLVSSGDKVVLRHLRTGDFVFMNRQPTLHRPSVQAHRVRVLGDEKTLRIHYSTCKAYNADFDGDELNCHFPQSHICRSEALFIANVAHQHIVPKNGTPLFGLIQDHLISGTLLCLQGRFFDESQFRQLIFSGLYELDSPIQIPAPSLIKPRVLWTGKQVISAVLYNMVPSHMPPLNLSSNTKISPQTIHTGLAGFYDDSFMQESSVIIRENELLCGFLDKTNIGASAYGLIHICLELYGGKIATDILSCLSRLFTSFLKIRGFSIGIEDTMMSATARESYETYKKVVDEHDPAILGSALGVQGEEEIGRAYRRTHGAKKLALELDRKLRPLLSQDYNSFLKKCFPAEFRRQFPYNSMTLMTECGAKGSSVNISQISCIIGQIELEGSRPAMMSSGRCLPMYSPYSTSSRSRGYVTDRFLTGMTVPSFFFHCMAGREGLVDTAIKTSQSGYLQRCLIKTLENLVVAYDLTVRDNDGSIVQFYYGEDGIDPTKGSCLDVKKFSIFLQNWRAILNSRNVDLLWSWETRAVRRMWKKVTRARGLSGFRLFETVVGEDKRERWWQMDPEERARFFRRENEPILTKYKPDSVFGAISDQLAGQVENYIKSNPHELEQNGLTRAQFRDLISYKYMCSLMDPGENVGVLAAQSIGEPSTQMTLNTFHFAGVGDLNVTLGMPRLKEIIMSMSGKTKTPFVKVPLVEVPWVDRRIEDLQRRFEKIHLRQALEGVRVSQLYLRDRDCNYVKFEVELRLNESMDYAIVFRFIEKKLIKKLNSLIGSSRSAGVGISVRKLQQERREKAEEDEEEGEGKEEDDEEEEEQEKDDEASTEEGSGGEPMEEEKVEKGKGYSRKKSDVKRMSSVWDYDYDDVDHRWCRFVLQYPFSTSVFDITSALEEVIAKSILYQCEGIEKSFVMPNKDPSLDVKRFFCTEGVNIEALLEFEDVLDFSRLETNDTLTVQRLFGIEAVSKNIIKEIRSVFEIYGIGVNYRHLSLIADFMTCEGVFRGCNRRSVQTNSSLLQRMSFESASTVLQKSLMTGSGDDFKSSSSRIAFGIPTGGTCYFDLVNPF